MRTISFIRPNPLLKKNPTDLFYDIIIIILTVYLSGASIVTAQYLPSIIGVVLVVIHFTKGRTYSKAFIILVILWVSINLLVMVIKVPFSYLRLFNKTIGLLFLPYLMISLIGNRFWIKFEQIVFVLTLSSMILYVFNNLFPNEFNDLDSLFAPFTKSSLKANPNYWSAIIYVNAFANGSFGLLRNCGFMWEPGGFAMMIIWAINYNWITKGMKFNRRIVLYMVALLTTFSTAGYFALLILLSAYFLKRISFLNIGILLIIILLFGGYVYQLEFLSDKVDTYLEQYQEDPTGSVGYQGKKVNRFQGGATAVIRTMEYPYGYGLLSYVDTEDQSYSYGVNGLGSLLEMWGIPLFIYLLFLMWRWFLLYNWIGMKKISLVLMYFSLLIVFFSNPISRFLLVYFIFMAPLAMKQLSPSFMNKNKVYDKRKYGY